ncbi:MAG: ATP-binding protein [Roseburia sp.]|nr:ATP-binding protein [Roseburia sp.]MCM1098981.1 ATP-binding protein [Ruminococcus flavefaciens]
MNIEKDGGKPAKLPIGIENFEKIRRENFYYVDKTGLIKEVLDNWGKVNLFTRPRRFGKSLNMSMLQYFFEYSCDSSLFEGLEISREKDYCDAYMGKFPVISVTLKDVCDLQYTGAKNMLRSIIGGEAMRFQFLLSSEKLSAEEKEQYHQMIRIDTTDRQQFAMPDETMVRSLRVLCELLYKHYGQKPIVLIDEYDVPLAKAQQYGYYEEMVALLRSLFGQVLKSNPFFHFAVLTGCLRIAKEIIFTGLNNLRVFSITNNQFGEHFGFLDQEVRDMLDYYGVGDKFDTAKAWYDGYRFGTSDVYCPWDVINYCADLRSDPESFPQAFWINTSGNDIIREFIRQATPQTRQEIEQLVNGESVVHDVRQELTYRDLYSTIDNLWSVLFTTGYLTQREKLDAATYRLAIPNLEIRQIFAEQVREWFQEEARRDPPTLDAFCAAFLQGNPQAIEERFSAYLRKSISVRDAGARRGQKENFYHGVLLGLLRHREDWLLYSNAESGEGFSDILAEDLESNTGIVIEVKYREDGKLEEGCREALAQIDRLDYKARLEEDGIDTILKYGIACNRKRCRVLQG